MWGGGEGGMAGDKYIEIVLTAFILKKREKKTTTRNRRAVYSWKLKDVFLP